MEDLKVPTSVTLPVSLKERAERAARADRRTVSSLVVIALERFLAQAEAELAAAESPDPAHDPRVAA